MDLFSPRTRRSGFEQRPRGIPVGSLTLVRTGGMTLLAMLLAVTFANLACG
jgi:hypothetical protein